jgi:hypothetical protein
MNEQDEKRPGVLSTTPLNELRQNADGSSSRPVQAMPVERSMSYRWSMGLLYYVGLGIPSLKATMYRRMHIISPMLHVSIDAYVCLPG